MQHIPFHTLVIALTVSAASAGPLTLTQDGVPVSGLAGAGVAVSPNRTVNPVPAQAYAQATYAQAPYAQAPARQVAANGPNLGGGFFEVLFGGAGNRDAPPRYEPAQRYETNFGMAPSAEPAQPAVDPRYLKQEVHYGGNERPGTIIINTNEKLLYLVQEGGTAVRYGIGVGRPGFTWSGVRPISRMREWPDWTPPPEMLKRRPDLPRHMDGGPDNPLGARAMYLGSSLYRIHGSNEPWTIGTNVSSGCIRMRNEDVVDLYRRVRVGTKVVVM
ncbi:MAG TPA: L,D-transpeptidase [Xanthobacteraceae bacterium]|jgi:lipoprotein-anchoring transpeptidase ErfK/SrfK|nr:L,D-transpeptidase [Xanthobacteraceae bacterium]